MEYRYCLNALLFEKTKGIYYLLYSNNYHYHYNLKEYLYPGNDIIIIRVGDKQSDKLNIPKEYEGKFNGEITKYCTLPELEIILIISENLWDKYQKVKSKKTPKEFAKENISYNGRKYKNDTLFYREYYGDSPEKLVSAIKVYKQKHKTHKKDELYLADLLK